MLAAIFCCVLLIAAAVLFIVVASLVSLFAVLLGVVVVAAATAFIGKTAVAATVLLVSIAFTVESIPAYFVAAVNVGLRLEIIRAHRFLLFVPF